MSISRKMEVLMGMVLLSIAYIASINLATLTASNTSKEKEITVVIDAGHGGNDPGKVSVTKALEKDINLDVSNILKDMLEEEGINVIMTREEDKGLYDENDRNKKSADMKARCALINSSNADVVISIHQNSYSSADINGAQVFYYNKSEEGKALAETIQKSLIEVADPSNTRSAKSNTNYYMLLHTDCPSVIVECGFLSNWEEAKKMESEDYQKTIAEGICRGVLSHVKK